MQGNANLHDFSFAPDVRYGVRPVPRLYFPVGVGGHGGVGLPCLQLELRHVGVVVDVHRLRLLPVIEEVLGRVAVAPDDQWANLEIQRISAARSTHP